MEQNQNYQTKEKAIPVRISGWLGVIGFLIIESLLAWNIYNHFQAEEYTTSVITIVLWVLHAISGILAWSTQVVNPNEGYVYTFLGRYIGTLKQTGFYWIPFWWNCYDERDLSLRTISIPGITVNDKEGNPIIIGCDIFSSERDTYAATFEISDLDQFLPAKTQVALRTLAMKYPMDTIDEKEHSLRGNLEEIRKDLEEQVLVEFQKAGYVIDRVAITSLSYAPEIASVMLQRQQAKATVDARKQITEGAVSIIKETLESLSKEDVVKFDESNKQKLVSNLLVTLCSHQNVSTVLPLET